MKNCNLPAVATLPTARWKYVLARVEKAIIRKIRLKRMTLTRSGQMRRIKEIVAKKTT